MRSELLLFLFQFFDTFILQIIFTILFAFFSFIQCLDPIPLNPPNTDRGSSVTAALLNRHSEREFSTKSLSIQDLSDLIWAAVGINRPNGYRTDATAINVQDERSGHKPKCTEKQKRISQWKLRIRIQ